MADSYISQYTVLNQNEEHFVINTTNRVITVPSALLNVAVKHDTNAQEVIFDINRYFDDIDLYGKTIIVQYVNANHEDGIYIVQTKDVTTDNRLLFSWKITSGVTAYAGSISFAVRFFDVDEDGNIVYSFNTQIAKCNILEGLSVDSTTEIDTTSALMDLVASVKELEDRLDSFSVDALGGAAVLNNYYKKIDTYSATEIDEKLSNLDINVNSTVSGQAQETVDAITWGWNLGNTLDAVVTLTEGDAQSLTRIDTDAEAPFYETCWGNVVTTKAMIDMVKAKGCNAVRIPITWAQHMYDDGACTISRKWLARVKEVIQYVLDNDMYCIINTHHDGASYNELVGQGYLMLTGWLKCSHDDFDTNSALFAKVWKNIATEFKDYDSRLIFESCNEIGWNGWSAPALVNYRDYNELQQIFVDTVRATGGNNMTRTLCVQTFLSGSSKLDWFYLPVDIVDNGIIVQFHNYSSEWNQDLVSSLENSVKYFADKNIPCIIGEFGTVNNSTMSTSKRAIHAQNFIARAKQYKAKCFWWDDGKGSYGLLDRVNMAWYFESIVDGMNLGVTATPVDTVYTVDRVMPIDEFEFKTVSIAEDTYGQVITDNSLGSITNISSIDISTSKDITITLTKANGYRFRSYALYDSAGNCVSAKTANSSTSIMLENSGSYATIKFSVYNPWGYRSYGNFKKSMSNGELEITFKLNN